MTSVLKRISRIFKSATPATKSLDEENAEIVSIYNQLKMAVPNFEDPNYELAKKVFLDFNDFNLRNIEAGLTGYLDFVPLSLLPYPKNYIKCAYYIFLEQLKREKKKEQFDNVQAIGMSLFCEYPDYQKYKKNLEKKKWIDEKLIDLRQREIFKELFGVYEISEEDYRSSPSSTDSTKEKLIHDFGVLPEIEEDVDMEAIVNKIS